jgi:hypothetical protein
MRHSILHIAGWVVLGAGPWLDHNAVFAAMFEAALQGFPNPPAGPRRVAVQIGQ